MNVIRLIAVCCIGMTAVVPGYAAGRPKIENVTPKVTLIGAPEIMATVAGMNPKRPRPPTPGENKYWLEFEVDFDALEEFPELTFKYGLVVSVPGRSPKLIEGDVTHVDIGRGKDRHSVMYIAPKTLNKISEGKTLQTNNIVAYWVEIVAQGELVGGNAKPSGDAYNQVQKKRDSLEKVGDALLNKLQTPFAPLFGDYFEGIKSSR